VENENLGKVRRESGWSAAAAFGLLLVVLILAAVLAGGGWVVLTGPSKPWLSAAVRSPLFIGCAFITFGCAVALVLLGRMLWRAAARERSRRKPQEGAVILEFAMVLPIALMLVLLMTQSAMLMGGNLCVHYAAYCAARSAIVHVPANANASEPPNVVLAAGASAKQDRIRLAAVWACMPVSCSGDDYPGGGSAMASKLTDGLDRFFSNYARTTPGWVRTSLGKRLSYADEYTSVDLEPPANGDRYTEHEDLRVRVSHTLYLSVPYANWFFSTLDKRDGVKLSFGAANYGMRIHAACTLTNEGLQDFVEPETFPQ
jgi:hypothetical protein